MLDVDCGEWQNQTETIPGPVMDQCQCDPGTWCYDPNTCCCIYQPGACHMVKVQCPSTQCCRRVWVPKIVKQEQCCTRYQTEVKHTQCPYTVCRQVPCTTTQRVPYTTCTYTNQTCQKTVPYTSCTWQHYTVQKQVPYVTCTWHKEVCQKQVPYVTC